MRDWTDWRYLASMCLAGIGTVAGDVELPEESGLVDRYSFARFASSLSAAIAARSNDYRNRRTSEFIKVAAAWVRDGDSPSRLNSETFGHHHEYRRWTFLAILCNVAAIYE